MLGVNRVSGGRLSGVVAVLAGVLLALVMLAGTAGTAEAKWKQNNCAKAKKQVKKAQKKLRQAKPGAAKRAAKARLKTTKKRLKHCRQNLKVYKLIRNGKYEGVDTSGPVARDANDIFCANGRYYDTWQWRNKGWRVTNSRFKNKKNFAAVVEGLIAHQRMVDGTPYVQSYRIALVRKGNRWTRGTVSFDDLSTLGNERPVTRRNAGAACKR